MENLPDILKQKSSETCLEQEDRDDSLFNQILSQMDLTKEATEGQIKELIDEQILSVSKIHHISLIKREELRKKIYNSIRRLGILQELLENPEITEIMVNGTQGIFIEEKGKVHKLESRFDTKEKLDQMIRQIVSGCNRVINEASPIVDARLPDGSRVNAVLHPVALNGPILTIRRFPEMPMTMKQLIRMDSLSVTAAEWLQRLVSAGYNILVSGGTGSGKTTFLNVLSQFIPGNERVITIEDSAELQIRNVPNLVSLETRNANVEGCREITIRDLIRSSLRMRPDRIIVGEVRGKETVDMLQSMNVGHCAMTTVHANSIRDVVSRLETMVLMGMELPLPAVRKQIVSAFDLMIQLGRFRDGSRRLMEIAEPVEYAEGEVIMNTIFRFEETGEDRSGKVLGILKKTGDLKNVQKLKAAGLEEK